MTRRPPRSPLFPSTPLFRSNDDTRSGVLWAFSRGKHTAAVDLICGLINSGQWTRYYMPITDYAEETRSSSVSELQLKQRSEEHTSELQSQSNLVCRLLLEQK